MRKAAGILQLASGAINFCFFIYLVLTWDISYLIFGADGWFVQWFYVQSIPALIAAIMTTQGGIFALRGKRWRWVLTGSIFTLVTPYTCVYIALVCWFIYLPAGFFVLGGFLLSAATIVLTFGSKRDSTTSAEQKDGESL